MCIAKNDMDSEKATRVSIFKMKCKNCKALSKKLSSLTLIKNGFQDTVNSSLH